MARYLEEFRELYQSLLDAGNDSVASLLANWADSNREILKPYRKFQQFNALGNFYSVEDAELWSLYALSRVCDTLLLPFQSGECWFDLSVEQFVNFWRALGVAASEPREYHPFWCEVVACENIADENAPPRIEEIFWPALMWGDLLICRAGVRVRAGRNWMRSDVAGVTPLYFASRRNYRKAHDLSHGWGSNSQWATNFRRDYAWGEHYIFNADGSVDGNSAYLQDLSAHEWAELLRTPRQFFASNRDDEGLSPGEREELLVNRCFVRAAKADMDDFWPYYDAAVWKQ